ncbi:uncharacterized protein LOC144904728 [Branchiostoma floridae x Branchiostoma belcheri]
MVHRMTNWSRPTSCSQQKPDQTRPDQFCTCTSSVTVAPTTRNEKLQVKRKRGDSRRNSPHYPPPFRDQVMTGSARKWKLTAAICGEAQSVICAGLRHNASSSGRRSQEWTFAAT